MPDGKWLFDDDVTRVFEDMLARSIPQYDTIRELVFEVGKHFARAGSVIVDLGASRGDAIAPFVRLFSNTASYMGVEVPPPMLRACRERSASEIASGKRGARLPPCRTSIGVTPMCGISSATISLRAASRTEARRRICTDWPAFIEKRPPQWKGR